MVGVCVAKKAGKVRVAVTGAGPGVFRVGAMEAALEGSFTPDAVAAIKVSSENLSSDIHADAEYRAHLVTVMAKKAVSGRSPDVVRRAVKAGKRPRRRRR